MRKEFYKTLINLIVIVSLLLALCVCVDYAANATNDTINNINSSVMEINDKSVIVVNSTTDNELYGTDRVIIPKKSDKIYTIKGKKDKKTKNAPTVRITAKPSCGCRYGYYWHTNTFVSYCPHCHKYGTLRNVHKWPARYEQELTCDPRLGGCGADYCGVCGKEKYSWSNYYLKRC